MSKPFLRVWCRFETAIESSTTSLEVADVIELTVTDTSLFEIEDKAQLVGASATLNGRVYHIDYANNIIYFYCPGHDTAGAVTTLKFFAQFMFYGIPHLGEITYEEWRNYENNMRGDLIQQPEQLQVVNWSIPITINGVNSSCVDRTVRDVLQMYEELSNKAVIVELLDVGFIQRLVDAYITNENLSLTEEVDQDFATQISFVGLTEIAV
jgi:hypothetical protein